MTDVIVIGAGHNGLTAAALLARKGRSVVVVDRRSTVGGVAGEIEFAPGYRAPGILHDTSGFSESVVRALQLQNSIDRLSAEQDAVFCPQVDGRGLLLHRDPQLAFAEIKAQSPKDAERYAQWRGFIERVRHFVQPLLESAPPPILGGAVSLLPALSRAGWSLRRLGGKDMMELLRVLPMSVADWLDDWFESDLLRATLAGPAFAGAWMGPRSPGSAANLLFRECLAGPEIFGGSTAVVRALELASNRVELRLGWEAKALSVRNHQLSGVEFSGGEQLVPRKVVCTADPVHALLGLLPPRSLSPDVEAELRTWRTRGVTAKVHLALDGPLEFAGRPGSVFPSIRISESLDDIERAFDAVKYGEFSERPHLDIRVPTVLDSSFAPDGHHVVSILATYAPHDLRGGWSDERRDALGDAVVAQLARYAPSVTDRIVARQVLTPADLEAEFGLTGGHLHHGEHALDQLLSLRPAASCAHATTPIEGLLLGGSGSHPGGGITGLPGMLAAARC